MKQHLLIINTPNRDTERYLVRLCQQIRETHSMAQVPIQLLTREFSDGLPRSLRELGVVHYAADTELVSNYQACNIEHAKYVFLMAQDDWAQYSDSLTFDILDKISSLNISAHIVAEVVNDENRERFMRMGVQAVIRPVRVYPEIAVRAMSAPGTETVLEDMFTHEGAHPIRLNLDLTSIAWDDFACTVIKHGFGIPLGYIDQANKVITNPAATELVFAKAVLLLANNHRVPTEAELLNCVADL